MLRDSEIYYLNFEEVSHHLSPQHHCPNQFKNDSPGGYYCCVKSVDEATKEVSHV